MKRCQRQLLRMWVNLTQRIVSTRLFILLCACWLFSRQRELEWCGKHSNNYLWHQVRLSTTTTKLAPRTMENSGEVHSTSSNLESSLVVPVKEWWCGYPLESAMYKAMQIHIQCLRSKLNTISYIISSLRGDFKSIYVKKYVFYKISVFDNVW